MANFYKSGPQFAVGLILLLALTPITVPAQNVVDVLNKHDSISIFVDAVKKSGVDSELNSGGPYTIFAPSNSALRSIEGRLNRANESSLRDFVMNHILTGNATRRHISAMSQAPTLGGLVLTMTVDGNDNVRINDARIIEYNMRAQNGVIHIIDSPLED